MPCPTATPKLTGVGRSKEEEAEATYRALAAGPGSLKRAARYAAARRLRYPSEGAFPAITEDALTEASEVRPSVKPAEERKAAPRASEWQLSSRVSFAYLRMHEELRAFVAPPVAARLLDESMVDIGVTPNLAESYDMRALLVEALPERLRAILSEDHAQMAVDAMEQALIHMHAPPQIAPSVPAARLPSTPPA